MRCKKIARHDKQTCKEDAVHRRKWSKLINKVSNWTAVTSDEGQSFDALEVSVFNRHDTSVSKQLLWVVIDELSACTHTESDVQLF